MQQSGVLRVAHPHRHGGIVILSIALLFGILLNDLGTYQGTIAGGSAQECVLLFETEKQNVENITSLQLKVSDGSTSTVSELQ